MVRSRRKITKANGSKFIAIAVGMGDAFFLQRGDQTALIDGGFAADGFPDKFYRATNRNIVDVLVCTHNDADHANGLIGFLQSGLKCNEVWLPGTWTYRLEDILLRPNEFTDELISDIKSINPDSYDISSLEVLGDQYREKQIEKKEQERSTASLHEAMEEIEAAWMYESSPSLLFRFIEIYLPLLPRSKLFIQAINAATRIYRIATKAYHSGATIRWFEYDGSASISEKQNFLIPMNSREVIKISKRPSALEYLALTTANKQSLVFYSPLQEDNAPAVLFSADSDFKSISSIPWSEGMIITAPHHGSEANKRVYDRFVKESEGKFPVNWVRSDGRFKKRPGNSYLNMKQHGYLFCTLCRGNIYPKQDVHLTVNSSGRWQSNNTQSCRCKLNSNDLN